MSLAIEDGSVVSGAESFATVAQARAYAEARGLTLPVSDTTVEQLLREAADYLDSIESRFKGDRTEPDTQELSWPRTNVYLFGSESMFAEDEIPALLIKAQCQLAVDANSSDLQPTGTGREIVKQVTDVIETEYAKRGSGTVKPELNKALAILVPLFKDGGTIRTLRV